MPPWLGRCTFVPAGISPRRRANAPDWESVRFLRRAFGPRPFDMTEIRAAADAHHASGANGPRHTVPGIPRHACGARMRRLEELGLVKFHHRHQPSVPRKVWGDLGWPSAEPLTGHGPAATAHRTMLRRWGSPCFTEELGIRFLNTHHREAPARLCWRTFTRPSNVGGATAILIPSGLRKRARGRTRW